MPKRATKKRADHDSTSAAAPADQGTALGLRQQLDLLDDRSDRAFDTILALAADLLDCAHAGILLHEGGRYWYKARGGKVDNDAAPSEGSLLNHTLASDTAFVVTDARADPRFRHHPRVAGPPHIRFYIGVPLIGARGKPVGALAVMDASPRPVPDAVSQLLLCQLAADIMREVEIRTSEHLGAIGRATGQAIAAGTSETVITIAPDWTVLLFQEGRDRLFVPPGDPLGASLWSLLPVGDSRLRATLTRAMTERIIGDFDEFFEPFGRLTSFRIYPLEGGGVVLTCRAADRASEVEAALRASEARLHRSEEHLSRAQRLAGVGSCEVDLVSGAQYWSEQLYRIFGLPLDAPIPTMDEVVDNFAHPDDRERLRANQRRLFEGGQASRCEYRIIRADGQERALLRFADVKMDEDQRPNWFVVAVQDVTEFRAAERERDDYQRQLQHAQRLDALGTLAGGIAHDLNNTLQPVLALTELMLRESATADINRRNLEVIHAAGERARDLVRQVLTFARNSPVQRQIIDLRAVIADSLAMVRVGIAPHIRLDECLMPAAAFADSGQIHQVVVNLVTNAVQAIGDRPGTVSVALSPTVGNPGSVSLVIADDGQGMDERTLSRMFEPFFTTKRVGGGLGLAIVHGIVIGHGGRIMVDSGRERGTRVTIDLPLADTLHAATPENVAA